jgi:hypothetical protein
MEESLIQKTPSPVIVDEKSHACTKNKVGPRRLLEARNSIFILKP